MTRSETDFARPGTYALILACRQTGSVRIGRLSRLHLQPGYYVYVGSALGTGGLQARLRHHLQIPARPHWHIDYLRAVCDVREVWFTSDTARFEHRWAKVMAGLPGAGVPLPRFGSSDCACVAHLLACPPSGCSGSRSRPRFRGRLRPTSPVAAVIEPLAERCRWHRLEAQCPPVTV